METEPVTTEAATGKKKLTKAEKKLKKKQAEAERRNQALRMEFNTEITVMNKIEKQIRLKRKHLMISIGKSEYSDVMHTQWKYFEKLIDKKDSIIGELLDELEKREREEEYEFKSKTEQVDRLIRNYTKDVSEMYSEYTNKRYNIQKNRKEQFDRLDKYKKHQLDYIKTIQYLQKLRNSENKLAFSGIVRVRTEESDNSTSTALEMLQDEKTDTLTKLFTEYIEMLGAYSVTTTNTLNKVHDLSERATTNEALIETRIKKTLKIISYIDKCKTALEYDGLRPNIQTQLNNLRTERKDLFKILRNEIKIFENKQKEVTRAQKYLISMSSETLKELRKLHVKGSKILRIDNVNHKLETIQEQMKKTSAIGKKMTLSSFILSQRSLEGKFTKFWMRVGHVQKLTDILKLERKKLQQENKALESDKRNAENGLFVRNFSATQTVPTVGLRSTKIFK